MTPERWKRIEELYHAARAMPQAGRAAFLAGACPDDEALRREVESLLNEPDSGNGLLDKAALVMPEVTSPDPAPMVGRSLGGYHLRALLGSGGMGEVYRARDTTLGRDVAIKVLPREFTSDPNRLARLAREARILAAVNHPGICAIYGFEEADASTESGNGAVRFLILELVEGETLAARLEGVSRLQSRALGLSLDETLRIASQIADALEVAHDKGIVHRDLKPANITITPDGLVKVLDFGLAKTFVADTGPQDLPRTGDTREGVVIGTAAYMSPEQARGLTVDKRTDIWAFGCVLFEMLTGRVAFAGDTAPDSIAKVLEREPDWTALPAGTPPSIRRLLLRCLAKDPKKRLRDIGDVRMEIDASDDEAPPIADGPPASSRARHLPWAITFALALGLAGLVIWNLRPMPAPRLVKFTIPVPPGQVLNASRGAHVVAISHDGANLAYSGTPHGLYLRSLSDREIKVIPGTEEYEVSEPTFSPDGTSIAFFSIADERLMRIPVTGGAAMAICATRPPNGISWGPEGIVFGRVRNTNTLVTSATLTEGVMIVSEAGGGTPRALVRVREGESAYGPQMLPGGTHVLFTLSTGDAMNRWDKAHMIVQSLSTGARTDLGEGSDVRYLPTGHLIYAISGSVYAGAFDPRTMKFMGDRAQVIQGVRRAAGNFTGAAAFSVADNGTLVYVEGPPVALGSAPMDLAVMDRDGQVTPLHLQPPGPYAMPRVSPDGSRAVFDSDDGKEAGVYYVNLSGANLIQRLTTGSNNRFPIWASERLDVAFQSDREGDLGIWWQPLNGPARRLTTATKGTSHAPESRFGETLLYSVTSDTGVSLRTLSLRDGGDVGVDAEPSSAPMGATISPDGKWLAYASTKGSRVTLYVQGFPSGVPYPMSAKASDTPKHPLWTSDRELCYNPNVSSFECVRIAETEPFGFATPVRIPKNLQMGPPYTRSPYDVTPDGRLVGVIMAGERGPVRGSENQIQVVVNWFEDLKTRARRR